MLHLMHNRRDVIVHICHDGLLVRGMGSVEFHKTLFEDTGALVALQYLLNSCFCKIPSSFPNYSQYKLVHHSQKQMCQYTFNLHLSYYA